MQHSDSADDIEPDVAGRSARHEYERRRQLRRERAASRGRLAHLSASLTAEPQSTKAWARGAQGEEFVCARLDRLREQGIGILYDRRIPGRENIDHLAVTPGGVWVIDTKRYKGRPELKAQGGPFRPRTEHLTVGGRDRDRLIDGVLAQVDHVRQVLGEIPATGALCFVSGEWPLFGGAFTTRGIQVLPPRQLVKAISRSATGNVDVAETVRLLDRCFKPA